MGKKLTTSEFIARAQQVHGSTYDYSLTEYVNASSKVEIICPVHGSFFQLPSDHTRGSGCALCNERQQLTVQQFTDRSIHVHNSKYTYEQVIYKNVTTKVDISCPSHGTFSQTPKDHLRGYGCPDCGGTKKTTFDQFTHRATSIHGDEYDYSRVVLVNMNTDVEIVCRDHGAFLQRPADHVAGVGCPTCGKLKQTSRTHEYLQTHPDEANTPTQLYLIVVDGAYCKVGITTKQYIKQRFPGLAFAVVTTKTVPLYEALAHEHAILNKYNHARYKVHDMKHTKNVSGWTECFPLSLLPELKKAVEEHNG